MNFGAISTELLSANYSRFDSSQTTQATYWINHAYGRIWAAAPWPWKLSSGQTIAATVNTRATTLWPSASMTNLKVAFVFDDNNDVLNYVTPAVYFDSFGATTTAGNQEAPGHPEVWTWIDGNILWGPVPDATYSFSAVLEKNIYTYTNAGAVTAGVWDGSTTTQVPAWNEPFHYTIVLGAMSIGLLMEQDPSWNETEGVFLASLQGMKDHFVPGNLPSMQFPADRL